MGEPAGWAPRGSACAHRCQRRGRHRRGLCFIPTAHTGTGSRRPTAPGAGAGPGPSAKSLEGPSVAPECSRSVLFPELSVPPCPPRMSPWSQGTSDPASLLAVPSESQGLWAYLACSIHKSSRISPCHMPWGQFLSPLPRSGLGCRGHARVSAH